MRRRRPEAPKPACITMLEMNEQSRIERKAIEAENKDFLMTIADMLGDAMTARDIAAAQYNALCELFKLYGGNAPAVGDSYIACNVRHGTTSEFDDWHVEVTPREDV